MPFQKIATVFLSRGTAKDGTVFYKGNSYFNLPNAKKKIFVLLRKIRNPKFDAELVMDISFWCRDLAKPDASEFENALPVEKQSKQQEEPKEGEQDEPNDDLPF